MADLTVPSKPLLVTVPNVELIHTGTWSISTGEWKVTTEDLFSAVAAAESPGIQKPKLKLGHVDPRFDGEPAIGWVDNMHVDDTGTKLLGDFVGVPAWFAEIMASAYPDRSIEGAYNKSDGRGRKHQFVLESVALLGVTAPGVTTLASIQDVAKLYGVVDVPVESNDSEEFAMTVNASGKPAAATVPVAASVSVDEVRRAFYDPTIRATDVSEWWWVEDVYVDPPEVIAVDDESGKLYRVPFSVDGNAVSFGDAQEVRREYVAASSTVREPLYTFANREESRPGQEKEEDGDMPNLSEELRKRLGIADDADDATIIQALDEALSERAEGTEGAATQADSSTASNDAVPTQTPATPEMIAAAAASGQTVVVEASSYQALMEQARLGAEARAQQQREHRESLVAAAVGDGRIPPARREHWLKMLETDPGAESVLASLAPGLVPVDGELGHSKSPADNLTDEDFYARIVRPTMGLGNGKE